MEEVKIDVKIRTQIGSQEVKTVRQNEDMIPGVVYGGGKEPTTIKFDRRTYEKIRRAHHGEIVFHLNVLEGEKKLRDYSAIVKEEQQHCVSGIVTHVDFKRISLKEPIEVKIPLVANGEAVGVKNDGGSLDHALWELDVVCLPTDILGEIRIDVSALEIGDSIHVADIKLPQGLETKHDPEAIVFSVVPPMKEEEVVEVDADAEPEVIKKEKGADKEETGAPEKESSDAAAEVDKKE